MTPTRVSNLAAARRDYGALADMYCEKLMQGDPLADAVVARMMSMPRAEAMAMLEIVAQGERDIREGRVLTHAEHRKRINALLKQYRSRR